MGAVGNNHDEGLLFLCLRPVLASPPETASSPRAYRPRTRFASASDTRGTAPRSTRRRRSGPTAGCPSPPRACARGPPLARTLAIDRGLAPRTSPWWTRARERPAWTARPSPVAHPPTRSTPSIRSTPLAVSPPRATELCRRHFVDDPFFLGDRRVQVRLFRFSRARFRPCFLSRGEKRGVKISPRKWMRSRPSTPSAAPHRIGFLKPIFGRFDPPSGVMTPPAPAHGPIKSLHLVSRRFQSAPRHSVCPPPLHGHALFVDHAMGSA